MGWLARMLERALEVFPILVPAWVIPTIVVGCTALGFATGAAIAHARRTRARADASGPQRAPAQGERSQRAAGKP